MPRAGLRSSPNNGKRRYFRQNAVGDLGPLCSPARGHGNSLGGVIVDSGTFPWTQYPEKFPGLNQPEPAYHSVVYTEKFGPAAFIARARTVPLRNTGAALAPMNAFLLLQGLETLALRMERHTENALKIAQFLQGHEWVDWVSYAGLPDHPHHHLAQKYMQGKPSAILSFGLKGGYEAIEDLIEDLQQSLASTQL